MNAVEAHFEKNYFATIRPVRHIPGLMVDFPKNLLLNLDECKFIYEVDGDTVIIYCDGVVVERVKCPKYASRLLINTDVSIRLSRRGLDMSIVRVMDISGNKMDIKDDLIYGLVTEPELKEDVEKEKRLASSIFAKGESPVDDDVVEGFGVIGRYYLREVPGE